MRTLITLLCFMLVSGVYAQTAKTVTGHKATLLPLTQSEWGAGWTKANKRWRIRISATGALREYIVTSTQSITYTTNATTGAFIAESGYLESGAFVPVGKYYKSTKIYSDGTKDPAESPGTINGDGTKVDAGGNPVNDVGDPLPPNTDPGTGGGTGGSGGTGDSGGGGSTSGGGSTTHYAVFSVANDQPFPVAYVAEAKDAAGAIVATVAIDQLQPGQLVAGVRLIASVPFTYAVYMVIDGVRALPAVITGSSTSGTLPPGNQQPPTTPPSTAPPETPGSSTTDLGGVLNGINRMAGLLKEGNDQQKQSLNIANNSLDRIRGLTETMKNLIGEAKDQANNNAGAIKSDTQSIEDELKGMNSTEKSAMPGTLQDPEQEPGVAGAANSLAAIKAGYGGIKSAFGGLVGSITPTPQDDLEISWDIDTPWGTVYADASFLSPILDVIRQVALAVISFIYIGRFISKFRGAFA